LQLPQRQTPAIMLTLSSRLREPCNISFYKHLLSFIINIYFTL